jgi:hypothetical protein
MMAVSADSAPHSQLEAPIVRAIRQDFAAVDEKPDPEAIVAPAMYGRSAEPLNDDDVKEFAEARALVRRRARRSNSP